MAQTMQAHTPPMEPSDEANSEQLQLACEQGNAFQKAVDEMTKHEAHGEEKAAGDYVVGYAVERAEGLYRRPLIGGELRWQEPKDENVHLEVVVRDGADRRFIPMLKVTATLMDADGREVGTHEQPFLWHPWLYHYGRNWKVPGSGSYTLKVRVDPPDFDRHDKLNGKRYQDPVEVYFTDVKIEAGQKK